jgi:hypothetical protein|tara:strand:- start:2495 stop:3379 length:885 start_codon:yes stop_codon:yes gene_type:complete
MLPDNFDFAMLPAGAANYKLSEIGILQSTIEDIDRALYEWVTDLQLSTLTNEGFKNTSVLWQTPERAYQVKHNKDLRDDSGALKLPLVSVERTGITKDPNRKGSFQAHIYSNNKDGRTGRMVIAQKIVPDKTQNFAIASGIRNTTPGAISSRKQKYYPRVNKKVIIKSLSIPIPVYVNVDYKITIKSEYQQHMNDLMAPFITRTGQINSFVMRWNGHLYEAFIDQGFTHNNNVNNLGQEPRSFSSEITIKVLGYLIGEGPSDDRPIVRVDENVVEYHFPTESDAPIGNATFFED